ncbi:MAG: aquaporin [Phycisphaeraceae bacterium]|nr:aquaporin [Phycisphaeraceae bacterium]
MPKLLIEFVGTFFLVLLIAIAVNLDNPVAPLFIGIGLASLVYMGGWVSGAHYNPAVSVALMIRGSLSAVQLVPYVLSQIAGGTLGALIGARIFQKHFLPAPGAGVTLPVALAAEALFTFLLALVVINVATVKKVQGNSYYGIAIGMTVAAGAYVAGPICGGAFNPAVALGGCASSEIFPIHIVYYILTQIGGAAAAALVFRLVQKEDLK